MSEATYDPTTHFLMTQREWDEETRIRDGLGEEVNRLAAEVDRLKTWPGLMETLAELYPPDVFDGSSGDPGPQIIALIRRVADLENQLAEAQRERDLAIAHDRQLYPTADAYDRACAAVHKHRQRADLLAAAVKELKDLAYTCPEDDPKWLGDLRKRVMRWADEALEEDRTLRARKPDLDAAGKGETAQRFGEAITEAERQIVAVSKIPGPVFGEGPPPRPCDYCGYIGPHSSRCTYAEDKRRQDADSRAGQAGGED